VQLKVELGATSVVALLDTGSTHNFITEAAALSLGLPIQPRPRLTVTVANGEKVSCPCALRQAPVTIDGREFRVDLFIMMGISLCTWSLWG
jgi:predicted aspartyl protease